MGIPRSGRASLAGPSLCLSIGVAACLGIACRRESPTPSKPAAARAASNLLLITVDTLRPDALGWVSGKNATPEIDVLAREGFTFPAAVSPVPLTLPSHASILTGLVPRRFGFRDNGQLLGTGPATLAEALRRVNYRTAAFVSGYPVASAFGLDRGFESYDDDLPAGSGADSERPAAATTAAALNWLRQARSPWFAWVHYYDPHYPYEPPAAFLRAGRRGVYDGEVAYVDRAIGDLRAGLGPGNAENTLTVFAADHGESLGEHGEGTHGFFVYESTVRVPLILHFRGRVAAGSSLAAARLVDITPTVLELLGQPALPGIDGVSLVPTLGGRPQELPGAYIETYQPWISYGWSPLKAMRHGGWKLIVAPRPELYDLVGDPGEERNVLEENRDRARQLQQLRQEAEALPAAPVAAVSADPEAVAKLRALGYLGAGGSTEEPPVSGLRDPKDSRELRDLLTEADVLLRKGDYRGSLPKFDAVLAKDPTNRFVLLRSGVALLSAGDPRRAIPRLSKAVEENPEQPEARSALAQALARAGRPAEAVPHAMEAVRLQPRRAETWAELGNALGLAKRIPEAVQALKRAVELEPADPKLLARLAFAEHAAGRVADAARDLERVASLQGAAFPHSGALGILLFDLGRGQEARRWLAASRPEEGDFAEARFRLARLEVERGDREAARRALSDAVSASPALRSRARSDRKLADLLR